MPTTDAEDRRRSWDLQQAAREPGREESFSLMLECVELLVAQTARSRPVSTS